MAAKLLKVPSEARIPSSPLRGEKEGGVPGVAAKLLKVPSEARYLDRVSAPLIIGVSNFLGLNVYRLTEGYTLFFRYLCSIAYNGS